VALGFTAAFFGVDFLADAAFFAVTFFTAATAAARETFPVFAGRSTLEAAEAAFFDVTFLVFVCDKALLAAVFAATVELLLLNTLDAVVATFLEVVFLTELF
jgi:hypothetical protein